MGIARLTVIAAVVVAAIVAIARFELLCLHDLNETADTELRYLTRSGWLAAIVLVIPIGGIAYLYIGRNR